MSTNSTPFAVATSRMAAEYIFSRAFEAATSALLGRLGSLMNSCAIGENSTSRGADLPLYFCASVCLMKASTFCLNVAKPASPAHDSL